MGPGTGGGLGTLQADKVKAQAASATQTKNRSTLNQTQGVSNVNQGNFSLDGIRPSSRQTASP